MATLNCTLGCCFAKRKFLAKTYMLHSTERFLPSHSFLAPQFTDEFIAELMETLRLQVVDLLRLIKPVQKRRRLLRGYWEMEHKVKELRWLFCSEFAGGV